MGVGLNKVMLIGRVGQEPEMRYTPEGRPVAVFSIVAARPGLSVSGQGSDTFEWFNVVAWDGLAERCATQVVGGAQAYVEGSLLTRVWTDLEGGTCARVEVAASDVIVLCWPGESADEGPPRQVGHADESGG